MNNWDMQREVNTLSDGKNYIWRVVKWFYNVKPVKFGIVNMYVGLLCGYDLLFVVTSY